ncbi:MAG: VWA domain-containing protein [Bryobacterales bacterium]|nr:VWA domain-containing protein [Bryobacterales bacterium]
MHPVNNRRRALAALAALSALIVPPLRAQSPDQEAVFRTETRLVVLHATVMDKNGHLVTNLARNAFRVFENGVEQTLKVFRREDVPVSLGLIVDNSGSMRDKRQKVESAALALVKDSNPEDEVFIVNFNDEAFLDKDFTSDIKAMEEGLTRIDSRGGTAMRDALRMSLDHLKEKAKKDKKVLVVVTDGNDNASSITLEHLVKAAQQSEVLVYAVGLLNEEERREAKRAKRALDALTEATGGQAYYPKEVAEVDKIAHQVAHDIRNQYILAYTPTNLALDGSFREVKVTVNGPNRPTVRTRSGYYATTEGARAASRGPAPL